MNCSRCGHCCIHYTVITIKPEAVCENLVINELTDADIYVVPGDGTPCPHLNWKDGEGAVCMIHHYPWFKELPCHTHPEFKPCRLGKHIVDTEGLDYYKKIIKG